MVLKHEFSKVVGKSSIFNHSDALVELIVSQLQILLYLPEDDIITQGEEGVYLYFVAKGFADVLIVNEQQHQKKVGQL